MCGQLSCDVADRRDTVMVIVCKHALERHVKRSYMCGTLWHCAMLCATLLLAFEARRYTPVLRHDRWTCAAGCSRVVSQRRSGVQASGRVVGKAAGPCAGRNTTS